MGPKHTKVALLPVHLWTALKFGCPPSSSVPFLPLMLAVGWLLVPLVAVTGSSSRGVFDFNLLPAHSLIQAGFLIRVV